MERRLHVPAVEVPDRLVLDADVDALAGLLAGRECQGLREHGGEADVERDVVLVDEAAGLAGDLVHHTGAQWRQRATIVLGDVARVVADGGEDAVGGVGDEAVRPEVLGAGVEVRFELENRVAQLIQFQVAESNSCFEI